jgi:hypothetical protein
MTVPVKTSAPVPEKEALQKEPVRVNHGARQRNAIRGVWELARLHTKESWLCWCPAGEQISAFRNPQKIFEG